jgi:hypothetical protein
MSTVTSTVRERIQAQGFCGLDDATYTQINYPLRLSPAICMIWAAVGTVLASATVLWTLATFAVLGAILPGHPFDVLYNYGLRHLSARQCFPVTGLATLRLHLGDHNAHRSGMELPRSPPYRWLQSSGGSLVAAAFVNVSTGFCIPALIARICFGQVVCE